MKVQQVNGGKTLLALLCSGFFACDRELPAQPDSVVTLTITSAREIPFHGPAGPGTEPISISFQWTVVLTTAGGPGATVRAIRTELRESNGPSSLAVATGPEAFNGSLRPGVPLQVVQSAAGFFNSALYPGQWQGNASADIVHPSGRAETLQGAFSFR